MSRDTCFRDLELRDQPLGITTGDPWWIDVHRSPWTQAGGGNEEQNPAKRMADGEIWFSWNGLQQVRHPLVDRITATRASAVAAGSGATTL